MDTLRRTLEQVAPDARWLEVLRVRGAYRVGRMVSADPDATDARGALLEEAVPGVWSQRHQLRENELSPVRGGRAALLVRHGQVVGVVHTTDPGPGRCAEEMEALARKASRLDDPSTLGATWIVGEDGQARYGEAHTSLPRIVPGRPRWMVAGPRVLFVQPLAGPAGQVWLVEQIPAERPPRSPLNQLSPTQQEVAEYAAAGATVAEIARALGRSTETVRTHMRRVYQRLDVGSRVELAASCAQAW